MVRSLAAKRGYVIRGFKGFLIDEFLGKLNEEFSTDNELFVVAFIELLKFFR
jgi:hypothetical protein